MTDYEVYNFMHSMHAFWNISYYKVVRLQIHLS